MNNDEFRKTILLKRKELQEQMSSFKKQIEACDELLSALPNQPELLKMPVMSPAINGRVNIFQAVEKAIDVAPREFSVRDIMQLVAQSLPPDQKPAKDTISSTLWNIAKDRIKKEKLAVKQKGSGRNPTIYVKSYS